MNEEIAWQALRYALEDPTLDRDAFESQMLADDRLALAVADAVGQLDLVARAASSSQPQLRVAAPVETQSGWHWASLAALAAAALLAVGLGVRQLETLGRHASPTEFAHTESQNAERPDATLPVGELDSELSTAAVPPVALPSSEVFGSEHSAAFSHTVAEQWLVMRREAPPSESLDGIDGLSSGDELRDSMPVFSEGDAADDDDWMLKAAREFYTQGVAS